MKLSLDEHWVGVWAYDMYIPRHRHGYGMTWPMDKHREKKTQEDLHGKTFGLLHTCHAHT
jgi:hypothetical protein